MLKRKLMALLLAAFAVTAVTAIAASTASAAFTLSTVECGGGPKWGLCWSETETSALLELTGENAATALGGENLFNVPELGVEILCKKVKDLGNGKVTQSEPLGTAANVITGSLNFEECALEGEGTITKLCTIPASEKTNELSGELTSETNVHLVPKTGTVFIEIEFKNKSETEKCPATVVGKRKVTGSQDLTVTNPGATLSTKSANAVVKSGLLFIEKAAELTGSITVTLTGFEDWYDTSLT